MLNERQINASTRRTWFVWGYTDNILLTDDSFLWVRHQSSKNLKSLCDQLTEPRVQLEMVTSTPRQVYFWPLLIWLVGLFLGSGKSLASAGPGGAVISYLLVGTIISSIISCIGEMTALMPVNAPMMEFPRRFLDRGVGFAVGWIYW